MTNREQVADADCQSNGQWGRPIEVGPVAVGGREDAEDEDEGDDEFDAESLTDAQLAPDGRRSVSLLRIITRHKSCSSRTRTKCGIYCFICPSHTHTDTNTQKHTQTHQCNAHTQTALKQEDVLYDYGPGLNVWEVLSKAVTSSTCTEWKLKWSAQCVKVRCALNLIY